MRAIVGTGIVALLLTSAVEPARADNDVIDGIAWGWTGFELTAAGTLTYAFTRGGEISGAKTLVYTAAPIVGGIGIGLGANALDLPARGAYAVHGGAWLGLDLALVGALIDGRGGRGSDRLRFGPAAWTLGALGAAGGAWLGASRIDGGDDYAHVWMAAPATGMVVGVLITGVGEMARPSAHTERNLTIGAITGLTLGLAAGWFAAETTEEEDPAPRSDDATPHIWSIGGAF